MALIPQSLSKYAGTNARLDTDVEDNALVKMGTLKAWMARVIRLIPNAGAGMALRRSPEGDIWNQTVEAKAFQVSSFGKVHPGLVGSIMPTLGGEPLDTTTNVLDLTAHSGNFIVWFTLNFTPTYLNTFLSSYTLDSVTVDTGTALPSDTDAIKHLQFNTITGQFPTASYFSASIPVQLKDNGASATMLTYT